MSARTTQPTAVNLAGRRKFLAASGALALAGCATKPLGTYETAEAPAPSWRVGDRWTYARTDYYTRLDAGTVTREVVAAGPSGARVVTLSRNGRLLDDSTYSSDGIQTTGNLSEDTLDIAGTLSPPFERYASPLASGREWRQSMTRTGAEGFHYPVWASTRVEGWETVRAGGRDVRAILIRRSLNLGPKDPFHSILYHYELEWYAPELRGTARLHVQEWLREGWGANPGSRYVYELVSFAVG